jgi:hypothetical protein
MRMPIAKSSGCAVSVSSAVSSSSTVPPERSTSTSTTSSTSSARVTPSSTSVLSLNTYVGHDITIMSTPLSVRQLTCIVDPQGQGREGPREGYPGRDGRQACEDQGYAREEAGACGGEACSSAGRRRRVSMSWHDEHLAWVFSRLKEGVILLSIWANAVMFHVTSVKDSSLCILDRQGCPTLIIDAMSVPKKDTSIGIRNQ